MGEERPSGPRGSHASEEHGIVVKPLPQILEELDANITLAAEAAERAGDAAKAAREAAAAATKASDEAAQAADGMARASAKTTEEARQWVEARLAGVPDGKQYEALIARVQEIEGRLAGLEAQAVGGAHLAEKVIVLRDVTERQAKQEIQGLFAQGETLYYSEIAERLRLPLDLVVRICQEMQQAGEIEVDVAGAL